MEEMMAVINVLAICNAHYLPGGDGGGGGGVGGGGGGGGVYNMYE